VVPSSPVRVAMEAMIGGKLCGRGGHRNAESPRKITESQSGDLPGRQLRLQAELGGLEDGWAWVIAFSYDGRQSR